MTKLQWSVLCSAFLGLSVAALPSCAKKASEYHKPVFPVQGQVFFKGAPAVGAQVMLHPASDVLAPGIRPHGQVDQNGTFVLTTYETGDGAPDGDYVVTIDVRMGPPRGGSHQTLVLPEAYGSAQDTPLRATVRREKNELAPFQITQ